MISISSPTTIHPPDLSTALSGAMLLVAGVNCVSAQWIDAA
jgi:hypothetical protein